MSITVAKDEILKLPNFDKEIFKEITMIDVWINKND